MHFLHDVQHRDGGYVPQLHGPPGCAPASTFGLGARCRGTDWSAVLIDVRLAGSGQRGRGVDDGGMLLLCGSLTSCWEWSIDIACIAHGPEATAQKGTVMSQIDPLRARNAALAATGGLTTTHPPDRGRD